MEQALSSVGASGVVPVGARGVTSAGAMAAPRMTFVAATKWLDSGVPVVSVMGELDLATAPALEETLLAASGDGEGAVIVDLARCSFIDLRGLHVLLAARARLEHSNRPLALVVDNPSLLRVFKITRVDALFAIYPSLTAAVGGNGDG